MEYGGRGDRVVHGGEDREKAESAERNIANNHLTGWIPQEFHSIPNLIIEGNSFVNGPAPPPHPYNPPPPHRSPNHHNHSEAPANTPNGEDGQNSHIASSTNKKSLITGSIIGILSSSVLFALCDILAALFCLYKFTKKLNKNQNKSRCPLGSRSISTNKGEWHQFSNYISSHAPTEWNFRMKEPLSSNRQSSSVQQTIVRELNDPTIGPAVPPNLRRYWKRLGHAAFSPYSHVPPLLFPPGKRLIVPFGGVEACLSQGPDS